MKKTYFKGNRAGNFVEIKLDTDMLEELRAALMAGFIARVGILGKKTERLKAGKLIREGGHKKSKVEAPQTNAEIGLLHEKGSLTKHVPRRSFLEMPLVLKSEGLLAIKDKLWREFILTDRSKASLKRAYVRLGMLAERIIQAAFNTGGFGKWPQLSEATKIRKKSSAILIDTAQLRRSITSDVIAK